MYYVDKTDWRSSEEIQQATKIAFVLPLQKGCDMEPQYLYTDSTFSGT